MNVRLCHPPARPVVFLGSSKLQGFSRREFSESAENMTHGVHQWKPLCRLVPQILLPHILELGPNPTALVEFQAALGKPIVGRRQASEEIVREWGLLPVYVEISS